jgi:hypothetical protein
MPQNKTYFPKTYRSQDHAVLYAHISITETRSQVLKLLMFNPPLHYVHPLCFGKEFFQVLSLITQ